MQRRGEAINAAAGKYSFVHDVHRRAWPHTWNIVPKNAAGGPDDTCTKCHRIGSISTCNQWVPDSTGDATALKPTIGRFRSQWSRQFPLSLVVEDRGPIASGEIKDIEVALSFPR